MNSSEYVENLITDLKNKGAVLSDVAWQAAIACVGWPYVYGARGAYCTPANRRSYYASKGDQHPTIKTACKNFDGSKSCSGCKWYPNGKKVRMFDCRGFTYWILKMVYDGWELKGGGATSQWNTDSNWIAKGTIDTMPKDTLVCLFVYDKSKNNMAHTGFGLNNETVECSSGVQYFTTRNKKWTHWGVPACENIVPVPTPTPTPEPTPEPGTAIVTGKNVALRYGPTTSAGIIKRIATGEKLKVTAPPIDWAYVTYSGKYGYMMKQYLMIGTDSAVVTGKNVALRYGPTTSAGVILRVPTGKTVKLTAPPNDWEHVEHNGKAGYMMKEFIKEG